jgi:hypothetical protein
MAESDDDYDPKTAEFLYDTIKDTAGLAMDQIKSVEGRGAQAFTAGTVLLGLASFGGFSTGHVSAAAFAFFILAVIGYLGAALASLKLLLPTSIAGIPSAAEMWERLRKSDLIGVKASLAQSLAEAETENDNAIKARAMWASRVVKGVAFEAVTVVIALLLSHLPS